MSLRHTYTLISPIYDLLLESPTRPLRRRSLAALDPTLGRVLLVGVGSGLDIPHLPAGPEYVGVDLTPAMVHRAMRKAETRPELKLRLETGDAMRLPYADASFDGVVMHLILAVVPDPGAALSEASRVVVPGGRILILDKFLKPGERAPLRRLINPLLRRVATRTDVVFEEVVKCCPGMAVCRDEPALARGWFRYIELRKAGQERRANSCL